MAAGVRELANRCGRSLAVYRAGLGRQLPLPFASVDQLREVDVQIDRRWKHGGGFGRWWWPDRWTWHLLLRWESHPLPLLGDPHLRKALDQLREVVLRIDLRREHGGGFGWRRRRNRWPWRLLLRWR
jgi:hypothetical protein